MTEKIQKACRAGDSHLLHQLLERNPQLVHSLDTQLGWTPLFRAVICGHYTVAHILLDFGADPNVKTRLGDTPLHQACDSNSSKLAKLLLTRGANPNLSQNDGHTPLHYACRQGNVTVVQFLLAQKANPNVKNLQAGRTPLHIAAAKGCCEVVLALLHHKASPLVTDYEGLTPADVAKTDEVRRVLANAANELEGVQADNSESDADEDVEFIGTISPPSFQTKTNRSFEESVSRTELETACGPSSFVFGSKTHLCDLYAWLSKRRLESLYDPLVNNGFDDVEALHTAAQDGTLNLDLLAEFGIFRPAHRRLLLAHLSVAPPTLSRNASAAVVYPGLLIRPSLEDWLNSLSLGHLLELFEQAGFDELDQLVFLLNSPYRLTDAILQYEVGIEKIGYRHRVLAKLRQEGVNKRFGAICGSNSGCELCTVM